MIGGEPYTLGLFDTAGTFKTPAHFLHSKCTHKLLAMLNSFGSDTCDNLSTSSNSIVFALLVVVTQEPRLDSSASRLRVIIYYSYESAELVIQYSGRADRVCAHM